MLKLRSTVLPAVLVLLPLGVACARDGVDTRVEWQNDAGRARELAREKKLLVLQLVSDATREGARARDLMLRFTLDDPALRESIRARFVAVARNVPDLSKDSQKDDLVPAFAALWPNGKGALHARTLVLTAEGELLHVIPGFVKPAAFRRELDFAIATGDKVEKAGASPKARLKAIADAHLAAGQDSERRFGVSEHVAVIRQRAYIAGVETSSTGVTPVLNPVIGTLNTGSVLEVTDAGVSGAGADPDERPDGFSRAVGAIHREIASDPEGAALDAQKGAQGKTAVAKGLVVDELAPRPTPAEVEAAQAALETKEKVDSAISAYASRDKDSAAWRKACASVRSSGKLALRLLLEETATGTGDAAFEALRRATGQLIPDDETAWTTYLSR